MFARLVAKLRAVVRVGAPAMARRGMALFGGKAAIASTLRNISADAIGSRCTVFREGAFTGLGGARWRGHDVAVLGPALAKAGAVRRRRVTLKAFVVAVRVALRNQAANRVAR